MESHNDLEWDALIKKAVKEVGLETPSPHFTEEILRKIQIASQVSPTAVYQPLIPKSVWLALAFTFIGIFCYPLFNNGSTREEWLPILDLEWLSVLNILDKIPTISISDTVIFSAVVIGFFILMQLLLLKRYMDSRISLGLNA